MEHNILTRSAVVGLLSLVLTGCPLDERKASEESKPDLDHQGTRAVEASSVAVARIYPVGDVDTYSFTVNKADVLVEATLAGKIPASSVQLSMLLQKVLPDGTTQDVLGTHSSEATRLRQQLTIPFINKEAGTAYRVVVRDYKDDQAQTLLTDSIEDTYSYSWSVAGPAVDPDGSKQSAAEITPDDADTCYLGSIERSNDQDWLKFPVPSSGIYQVSIDWSPATNRQVTPNVLLMDDQGAAINEVLLEHKSQKVYVFQELLNSGDHFLSISGTSDTNTDLSSTYQVCVNAIESSDLMTNDNPSGAIVVESGGPVSGSLDYRGDIDFYTIENLAEGELISILIESSSSACRPLYGVSIVNAQGEKVFSDSYFAGDSNRRVQFRVPEGGDYSVGISEAIGDGCFSSVESGEATSKQYELTLETLDIETQDPGESTSTCAAPFPIDEDDLRPGTQLTGKISYQGDSDCYSLVINDNIGDYRVLVAEFSSQPTYLDYEFKVDGGDDLKLSGRDFDARSTGSHWRKSFLIAPGNSSQEVSISVKDMGGDESDLDSSYTVNLYLHRLEEAQYVPDPSGEGLGSVITSFDYYNENDEQKRVNDPLYAGERVAIDGVDHIPNTSCMAYENMTITQVPAQVEEIEGEVVVVSPEKTVFTPKTWCAGHIDQTGDYDLYELRFREYFKKALVSLENYNLSLLYENDVVVDSGATAPEPTPDPMPPLPPTPHLPSVSSVAGQEEIAIRQLPAVLTAELSGLYGADAKYLVRFIEADGDLTDYVVTGSDTTVTMLDDLFNGVSAQTDSETANTLVENLEHYLPDSKTEKFVCKFQSTIRSAGSYNEYGAMMYTMDSLAARNIAKVNQRCTNCFGEVGAGMELTANDPLNASLSHRDVDGSKNGLGFYTEVAKDQEDKTGILRVFDRNEEPNSDGGFYDAPYYVKFGMSCNFE